MKCHPKLKFLLGFICFLSAIQSGNGFFFHLFRKGRSPKRPYSTHGKPSYHFRPNPSSSNNNQHHNNNLLQNNHHTHTSSCGWKPYYGPQYHVQKPVTISSSGLPNIQVHPTRKPYRPLYSSSLINQGVSLSSFSSSSSNYLNSHLTTTLRPNKPNSLFVSYTSNSGGGSNHQQIISSTINNNQASYSQNTPPSPFRPLSVTTVSSLDPYAHIDGYGPPNYKPPPPIGSIVQSNNYAGYSSSSFNYVPASSTASPLSLPTYSIINGNSPSLPQEGREQPWNIGTGGNGFFQVDPPFVSSNNPQPTLSNGESNLSYSTSNGGSNSGGSNNINYISDSYSSSSPNKGIVQSSKVPFVGQNNGFYSESNSNKGSGNDIFSPNLNTYYFGHSETKRSTTTQRPLVFVSSITTNNNQNSNTLLSQNSPSHSFSSYSNNNNAINEKPNNALFSFSDNHHPSSDSKDTNIFIQNNEDKTQSTVSFNNENNNQNIDGNKETLVFGNKNDPVSHFSQSSNNQKRPIINSALSSSFINPFSSNMQKPEVVSSVIFNGKTPAPPSNPVISQTTTINTLLINNRPYIGIPESTYPPYNPPSKYPSNSINRPSLSINNDPVIFPSTITTTTTSSTTKRPIITQLSNQDSERPSGNQNVFSLPSNTFFQSNNENVQSTTKKPILNNNGLLDAIALPIGYGSPNFKPPPPLGFLPDTVTDPPLVTHFPTLPAPLTDGSEKENKKHIGQGSSHLNNASGSSESTTTPVPSTNQSSIIWVIDGESKPVSVDISSSITVEEETEDSVTTTPVIPTTTNAPPSTTQYTTKNPTTITTKVPNEYDTTNTLLPIQETTTVIPSPTMTSTASPTTSTQETTTTTTVEKELEEERKAKDYNYPSIVSQIDGNPNWPWTSPKENNIQPDVHSLTNIADLSGQWFQRPSEGGLRSAKEFQVLTSFLMNETASLDNEEYPLYDEEYELINEIDEKDDEESKRTHGNLIDENTTYRPDNLVIFYPLNGKPFLSFVPEVEFADIGAASS